VRLEVRDEGIGIAPELLGKVFDVFYQQPQSLDRSKGGLGLGLAIVRNLVELHGGTVSAESAGTQRGSRFVVELPFAPGAEEIDPMAARAPMRDAQAEAGPRIEKRILVVDDNTDAAETIGNLLRTLGSEIATAHDGPEALRAVLTFKPDICLVDIGLPVMDGYELARRLRDSHELAAGARLIAVTGYGQDADRERSRRAGFDAHLVKPVDIDLLARAVATP
jgi:CheY-like chemotaxis protein